MTYYPIIDLASIGPPNSDGGGEAAVLTLEAEDEVVLPVFTSLDRLWAFVDHYYTGEDSVQPSTFPIDPFRLAEMIGSLGQASRLGSLVFNPLVVSNGRWKRVGKLIPVAHYCRFISEIRPGVEELTQESKAKFGTPPLGSEAWEKIMKRSIPQLERLADSAGARVEEW